MAIDRDCQLPLGFCLSEAQWAELCSAGERCTILLVPTNHDLLVLYRHVVPSLDVSSNASDAKVGAVTKPGGLFCLRHPNRGSESRGSRPWIRGTVLEAEQVPRRRERPRANGWSEPGLNPLDRCGTVGQGDEMVNGGE